jgi:hypothetical protein
VIPAHAVAVYRLRGEAVVDELKQRARTVRDQVDLDRARARGDELLVALPAPGEDDAPPLAGLDVLAERATCSEPSSQRKMPPGSGSSWAARPCQRSIFSCSIKNS